MLKCLDKSLYLPSVIWEKTGVTLFFCCVMKNVIFITVPVKINDTEISCHYFFTVGRSTLVGQRLMKSLSPVCPSVCPSVRSSVHLSLNFLKIGSLVFSDIIHDDSLLWYLVAGPKYGLTGPNWGRNGLFYSNIVGYPVRLACLL